jgi:hypothetical protein
VPEVFAHGPCRLTLSSQPQLNIRCIADMIGYCARAVCEYLWHLTIHTLGARTMSAQGVKLLITVISSEESCMWRNLNRRSRVTDRQASQAP